MERLTRTCNTRHFTYPAAQVDGEYGLLLLLQEKDDHEGKGVRGDATLSLAVNMTQLWGRTYRGGNALVCSSAGIQILYI